MASPSAVGAGVEVGSRQCTAVLERPDSLLATLCTQGRRLRGADVDVRWEAVHILGKIVHAILARAELQRRVVAFGIAADL